MTKCVNCGKRVKEVCGDGYCRACHKSLSFEDCVDGTWLANKQLGMCDKAGVDKEEHRKFLKELYPKARI